MMKRKIAIYIILIGVVIGSAPYLTGMLVESKFDDVINLISQTETVPAKITVLDYHRGWRKSTAKTAVTFYSDRQNKLKEYHLIFNHTLRHGPFVQLQDDNWKDWEFAQAVVISNLALTKEAEKIIKEEVGQTQLVGLNSIFAMDGSVSILATAPVLKLKEHQGTDRVAFKGLRGEWLISANMKEIKSHVMLPGMDFDLEGAHFFAANLNYYTHLSQSPSGLWPGRFDGKLDKLMLVLNQGKFKLNLEGFSTQGLLRDQGSVTDLYGEFHVDKLTLNEKVYGPIDYSNTLKHVDTQLLKSFLTLNYQLKTGDLSAKNKMLQFFLTRLPDFLSTRPEFSVDKLFIHTASGDVNGQLYAAIGGVEANNVSNIPQVLKSIVAKAKLEIPKTMIRDMLVLQFSKETQEKQASQTSPTSTQETIVILSPEQLADETINKWLQAGTLVQKDQLYEINIDFKEGNFLVNGRVNQIPIPLKK